MKYLIICFVFVNVVNGFLVNHVFAEDDSGSYIEYEDLGGYVELDELRSRDEQYYEDTTYPNKVDLEIAGYERDEEIAELRERLEELEKRLVDE